MTAEGEGEMRQERAIPTGDPGRSRDTEDLPDRL